MARFIIFLLLVPLCQLQGQELSFSDARDSLVLKNYLPDANFKSDSLNFYNAHSKILNQLYADGYLEAAYAIEKKDSIFIGHWVVGDTYDWAQLSKGNLPEYLVNTIGFREKFFANTPFRLREFKSLFEQIISESENNGYPFASVEIDSINILDNTISGTINYDAGPEITFDQLIISGTERVSIPWLTAHLGIIEGRLFSQKLLDNISFKIEQLPFIDLANDFEVIFKNAKAEVQLELNYTKANSLDGIIGFLPNEQEEGSLLITGQLFLDLNNLFTSGKRLTLEWQSLKARSQLLNIAYKHPNIFKSPIDLNANFYLLKEDSFFINRDLELATVYRQSKSDISLFYRARNSSTLTDSDERNDQTDFNINYYGLGYTTRSANYDLGNVNGLSLVAEGAIGSKTEELRATDSLDIEIGERKSIQYQFTTSFSKKTKISRAVNLFLQVQAGIILNEEQLYRNDLFRIGGLRSVRGFNENFFFADRYSLLRTELRFYYEQDSYLFMFYDQSYLRTQILGLGDQDFPLGLGLGMALNVKGGMVNLAYGLGRSKDQQWDFRLSKFHFGYIARF